MIKVWDNELIAKKKPEPVMDGLIFWLDGRDELYGDTVLDGSDPLLYAKAHMFDRVNDASVLLNQFSNKKAGIHKVDDSWLEPLNGAYVAEYSVPNVKTIEYVCVDPVKFAVADHVKQNNGRLMYPNNSGAGNAIVSADLVIRTEPVHIVATPDVLTGGPRIYQNGVLASTTQAGTSLVVDFFTSRYAIFADGVAGKKFGFVRLYNRPLSEDEILQNLEYEKSIGRVVL